MSGSHRLRPLGALLVALVALACLSMASHANAAYEQAKEGGEPVRFGTPEQYPDGFQFYFSSSMAVNPTGIGGVTPGSFYVESKNGTVMRFGPGKEGEEPQLQEEWGWGLSATDRNAYVRCGPAYQGQENPAEHIYEQCYHPPAPSYGELPGQFGETGMTLAIDHATGDVYVRSSTSGSRQHHLVQVFTAKGEIIGEGFGDAANGASSPPESIAESPGKLHRSEGGIAVDNNGTVYLLDLDYVGVEHPESRVMSFKPCTSGDYESYCYAAGHDLPLPSQEWTNISLIGDQHVVVASQELMQEYPLNAQDPDPVCSQSVTGQLQGMTANELTGEIFWFRAGDGKLRRLAPCDESTGKWAELEAFRPNLEVQEIQAMAVNPTESWGPLRPDGVLYAVEHSPTARGTVFVPARAGVHPVIESERATSTSSTSSVLRGRIDPRGADVNYHFEYLSDADYAANGESFTGPISPTRAPLTDGLLPSGPAANVAAAITGLTPGTAYHFRLIATSECEPVGQPLCETVGAGGEFTTFATGVGGLLDNRAYELVSPAEKNGGEVFPADGAIYSCLIECKPPGAGGVPGYPMQSSPSGDAVTYEGFPFSSEGSVINSYVSSRATAGWQTTTMTPPLLKAKGGTHLAYSTDLSEDILAESSTTLSPEAPSGYGNYYLQKTADPEQLTPLITSPPPNRSVNTFALEYKGHSPDFAGQFVAANDVLTQSTPDAPEPPLLSPAERDLYEWRNGALSLVNVLPGNEAVAKGASFASVSPDSHGVSADGSRVFWAAGGKLFVREDGQSTRELAHAGNFLSASENGDEVLFTDGCLYALASETCTDLTQGKGGFLGIAGQNQDLSRIYFVDSAALPGQNERGEEAVAGKPNLYLYEEGAGTSFIATLGLSESGDHEVWNATPVNRHAEASPDGRYLAFTSDRKLTNYDNVGECGRKSVGAGESEIVQAPCEEVFLYDSATGRLECASCSPTGEMPRGSSHLRVLQQRQEWFPQPRYLTDRGRLFFDSGDRLSPLDVNGRVEDVYELEPDEVGSCEREGGCLSLVSPGTGEVDSNFFAMGGEGEGEGKDVFFTSRERLVRSDTDELIDLYDAREEGGFPAESGGALPECQGESCQPLVERPTEVTPASTVFHGAGNLHESKKAKHKKAKHKKKKQQKHKHKSPTKKAGKSSLGGAK